MPLPSYQALSLFYLTSFGVLGVYLPYFNLYLEDLGFSGLQIGILSALLPLCGVIVPTAGGLLADRLGRRRDLVILSAWLALIAFSFLLGARGFLGVALGVAAFAILRAPAVPLVDATAMELSERGGPHYGRMRVWGSVSFILAALGCGRVVGLFGDDAVLHAAIVALALNALAALFLPKDPIRVAPGRPRADLRDTLRQPRVLLFLAACVLSQASHGPYYVFYSIHLEKLGYRPQEIGLLWALAVTCEIVAMLKMPAILKRLDTLPTVSLSLLLAAVRWTICAVAVSRFPLVLAQTLHAATFAAFHVAAVTHTHRLFGEDRRASGQAIYSSATFGLGNVLGMFLSGFFYDRLGIPGLFVAGTGIALLGALFVVGAARWRHQAPRGL
jgi:PPP family 3-phenylpropionic acid transporter